MAATGGSARSRCGGEPWVGLFSQDEALSATSCRALSSQPGLLRRSLEARRSIEPSATPALEDWFLARQGRPRRQASSGSPATATPWWWPAAVAILGELYGSVFRPWYWPCQARNASVSAAAACRTAWAWVGKDFGPTAASCCSKRPMPDSSGLIGSKNGGVGRSSWIGCLRAGGDIPDPAVPLWLAFGRHRQRIGPRGGPALRPAPPARRNPGPAHERGFCPLW